MQTAGRPLPLQLAWHALATCILVCLPLLKWKVPWWELSRKNLLALAVMIAAYGAVALATMIFVRNGGLRAIGRAFLIALSIFGLFLLASLLLRLDTPRFLLLGAFVAVVLAPISAGPRATQLAGIVAFIALLLPLALVAGRSILAPSPAAAKVAATNVKSAFYALRMVSHAGVIPIPETRGGGLDRLGDRVLLGTGDGHLYALHLVGDRLQSQELPARVPANREEFAAAFGGSSRAPRLLTGYAELAPEVQTWRFRVADVIARVAGDEVRIFASHHYWKAEERCFVVRVSQLAASLSTLAESMRSAAWQTIYESQPCLPMSGPRAMRGKNPFRGEEIGGRMALLDAGTLLLVLGEHGFSGMESEMGYGQDPQASYGKSILIDLQTHASTLHTLGHRNPQGLFVGKDGRLWQTEHGAQGGDELNLLVKGANYGWPLATYGTEYGAFIWPLSSQQGSHRGFTAPVYSWVPGIGISNVIQIERDRFAVWQGDLLLGSLSAASLYRVVLDGDRAVVTEPIPVRRRVRDLLELQDGRLLLWTDDEAALVTIEPATGSDGELEFATLCSACHAINDGWQHRMGPDLRGLMDRKVATADNYHAYTPALRQFGGRWDRQRLDAFLRDPQSVVPGTSMAFPGIADERQRAMLIDYLIAESSRDK